MGGETPKISSSGSFAVLVKSPDQQIMDELQIPIRDANERFKTLESIFQNLLTFDAKELFERLKTKNEKDPLSDSFYKALSKNEISELLQILEAKSQEKPGFVENLFEQAGDFARVQHANDIKNQQKIAAQLQQKALFDKLKNTSTGLESLRVGYTTGKFSSQDLQEIFKKLSLKELSNYARSMQTASPPIPDEFKNAFLQATSQVFGNSNKSSSNSRLAFYSVELAATMSTESQLSFLDQLNKRKKLGEFIKEATSYKMPNEENEGGRGLGYERYMHKKGLPTLLKTLAYSGIQDGRSKPLSLTQDELTDLRIRTFNSVSEIYSDPKRLWLWGGNSDLKDGMSAIFKRDFDKIWYTDVSENSENKIWISKEERKNLKGFFQHVLFTHQPGISSTGVLRDSTSEFLANHMGDWLKDIKDPKLDDKHFVEKYGLKRHEMASILGKTMALVKNGMDGALKSSLDLKAKSESERELGLRTFIELALTFVPGHGGELGRDLANIEGHHHLGTQASEALVNMLGVSDAISDKIKDMTKEQAAEFIAKNYPGVKLDKAWLNIYEYVGARIPSEYSHYWSNAYNTVNMEDGIL